MPQSHPAWLMKTLQGAASAHHGAGHARPRKELAILQHWIRNATAGVQLLWGKAVPQSELTGAVRGIGVWLQVPLRIDLRASGDLLLQLPSRQHAGLDGSSCRRCACFSMGHA